MRKACSAFHSDNLLSGISYVESKNIRAGKYTNPDVLYDTINSYKEKAILLSELLSVHLCESADCTEDTDEC